MKALIILLIITTFIGCSKEDAKHSLILKYKNTGDITVYNYKIHIIDVSKEDTTIVHLDTLLYQKVEQVYSNGDYKLLFGGENVSDSTGIVIKTNPFGEILYSRNNSGTKFEINESRNIEKMLLKFYPMLPYKKVKIGETWNRSQVMHTEDDEFWGDLHLNKLFKLISVKDNMAEIEMSIKSNSVLSKKMDSEVKMDVDINVNGKTFINTLKGEVERIEFKSTVIKSTDEEKIFSQRDMSWNKK